MAMSGRTCLVLGGAGNLGSSVVNQLLEQKAHVVSFDRIPYQGSEDNVFSVVGDICDAEVLQKAMKNIEIVFHTAAMIDLRPVPSPIMQQVNVDGTKNVINCCKANGVKVLVFTSSFYVVSGYDSKNKLQDFVGADESAPAPRSHALPYAGTKAMAEIEVLAANSETLRTVAVRPGYIVGPGCIGLKMEMQFALDRFNYFVTSRLPGDLMCTHVRNCAIAHILAADHAHNPDVGGKPFFVGDFEANVTDLVVETCKGTGMKPVLVPHKMAYWVLLLVNFFWKMIYVTCCLCGLRYEMPGSAVDINAFLIAFQNMCFSSQRAQDVLGYKPNECNLVTKEQTIQEMKEWANQHWNELQNKKPQNASPAAAGKKQS